MRVCGTQFVRSIAPHAVLARPQQLLAAAPCCKSWPQPRAVCLYHPRWAQVGGEGGTLEEHSKPLSSRASCNKRRRTDECSSWAVARNASTVLIGRAVSPQGSANEPAIMDGLSSTARAAAIICAYLAKRAQPRTLICRPLNSVLSSKTALLTASTSKNSTYAKPCMLAGRCALGEVVMSRVGHVRMGTCCLQAEGQQMYARQHSRGQFPSAAGCASAASEAKTPVLKQLIEVHVPWAWYCCPIAASCFSGTTSAQHSGASF